jgi:hypothetical protein
MLCVGSSCARLISSVTACSEMFLCSTATTRISRSVRLVKSGIFVTPVMGGEYFPVHIAEYIHNPGSEEQEPESRAPKRIRILGVKILRGFEG